MRNTPPPPVKRYQLDTMDRCRRELAKLYGEARRRELDAAEASKLGNIVVQIARLIEGGELERRIEELEKRR